MSANGYQYVIEMFAEDGQPLGHAQAQPDWSPVCESARFLAMRRGRTPIPNAPEQVLPVWDAEEGAPYVAGVRAVVETQEGEEVGCEAPRAYFRPLAQAASAEYVERGALKEGDTFKYQVSAFARSEAPAPSDGAPALVVTEVTPPLEQGRRPLQEYRGRSAPFGELGEEEYPVFLPARVLEESAALKDAAGELETGGVLIGFVWRDTESAELFTEITALVPAPHTVAKSTSLTFTAETWSAVQAAIRLRGRGESQLAWVHSHPARHWCHCAPESQRNCPLGRQFFSAADATVHRAAFPRAHSVALVVGDRPAPETGWETTYALFGWSNGMIVHRGFYVLND